MKKDIDIGYSSYWKEPGDIYFGVDSTWKKVISKLIGRNGKWVEVFDDEDESTTPYVIDEINNRSMYPGQADIILTGQNLSNTPIPSPRDYTFYQLRKNMAEYSQNYANMVALGDTLPTAVLAEGGTPLDPILHQRLQYPLGGAGYDLLGLLGSTGKKYWHFFLKFKVDELSTDRFLFYSASGDNSIAVICRTNNSVVFQWKTAAVTLEVPLGAAFDVGEWAGVSVIHSPISGSNGDIQIMNHTGGAATYSGAIPYFVPAADTPIYIGYGVVSGNLEEATYFFHTSTTHPDFVVTDFTIYNETNAYRGSQPGGVINPGTGKYYLEFNNHTSYDLHFGVGEPGMTLTAAPGVYGWCMNTINGRIFNHQTGGGTNWSSAIPDNSRVGLLYDSDLGQIEIFVNGVSRGRPFAVGSIAVPVTFVIGGRGNTTLVRPAQVTAYTTAPEFLYPVSGAIAFPRVQVGTSSTESYFDGTVCDAGLRGAALDAGMLPTIIDPSSSLKVVFKNKDTGTEYDASNMVIVQNETSITMTSPMDVPDGIYEVFVKFQDAMPSNKKIVSIHPFEAKTTALNIDFSNKPNLDLLLKAHKQWGGANGGVIHQNVIYDKEAGVCKIRACGDQYTGPLLGVDRFGQPSGFNTRMGGAVVTRDYYGPGSYRVVAKLPPLDGVVSAFWTFHYEEGYEGHPKYQDHLDDGLREVFDGEGYYTVRNHEIDIEIPTALKGDPDMEVVSYLNARFNTWQGENRNWALENDPENPLYWTEYTDDFINHGVSVNDGEFHEFRFDWHIGTTPRVDFYIDGVLKHTVTETIPDIPGRFWISLWFPSATNNHWAGKFANWEEQWMEIKSIKITPFNQYSPRLIAESYPLDVFRRF